MNTATANLHPGPYIPSEVIRDWLESGEDVFSSAAGRIGPVVDVRRRAVRIKLVSGKVGATTFFRGDKVRATRENNRIVIKNI